MTKQKRTGANMGEWRDVIGTALIELGSPAANGAVIADEDIDLLLAEICEAHEVTMSVGQRDAAMRQIRLALKAHSRYVTNNASGG
jgi:hypothetical protein